MDKGCIADGDSDEMTNSHNPTNWLSIFLAYYKSQRFLMEKSRWAAFWDAHIQKGST
jgi:hypothetical protein